MGKILVKKDRGYGCFIAGFNCVNCGVTVLVNEFSYTEDKIAISNSDKINEVLENKIDKEEIIFCKKCGDKL